MLLARAALIIAVTLGAGCGVKSTSGGSVKYATTAEENYQKGLNNLEKKDWAAAAKYFGFVKARFPYSKFAVTAKLRLADAEFGAGNYLAAIDAYRTFMKFHPTHEQVKNGYADFKVGESFVKLVPTEFFLVPPTHEMDQGPLVDAHAQLGKFLSRHPKGEYSEKARELRAKVNKRLAAHEWYVANFYFERGKPMATVLRLRRLLERHKGTGYDGDALWLLGRAYLQVGMNDRARKTFDRLVREHPKHKNAGKARAALNGGA